MSQITVIVHLSAEQYVILARMAESRSIPSVGELLEDRIQVGVGGSLLAAPTKGTGSLVQLTQGQPFDPLWVFPPEEDQDSKEICR